MFGEKFIKEIKEEIMGLDMYLDKRWTISEYYRQDTKLVDKVLSIVNVKDESQNYKHVTVIVPAIYWRKANQIHKWFVNNCQDGNDDCQSVYVSREQLEKLLDIVKKQLRNKKKIVLEPTEGFFFGSVDVDEWYWKDLEDTERGLKREIKFAKDEEKKGRFWEFYYQASW